MKFFKIITVNFLVFISVLVLTELFFRLNNEISFLPAALHPVFMYDQTIKASKEEVLSELGESILTPLPEKFHYTLDTRIKNLIDNQYPAQKVVLLEPYKETPPRNQNIGAKAFLTEEKIPLYDVHYKYNEYSRRETSIQNYKLNTKKAFLAFGCSMTFGQGVEQGMDYPSLLASKLSQEWSVYNFGIPGGAPNDHLDKINTYPDFIEGVQEAEGAFAWLFIKEHMNRFFCPWNCYHSDYSWILDGKSEYVLANGSFQKGPIFSKNPNWERELYNALSQSAIVQRYGYGFENNFTQEDYDLFVQSLDQLMNYFANIKFKKKYIILYGQFPELPLLLNSMKKFGFEAINYYKIHKVIKIKHSTFPFDNHPTSESTWYLSEVIKNRIEKDLGAE